MFSKDFGVEKLVAILHRATVAAIFRCFATWKLRVQAILRREQESALGTIIRFFRSQLLWRDGQTLLLRLRGARDRKCAVRIQAVWRSHSAKSRIASSREARLQDRAARAIQGLYRIRDAYTKYRALKLLWAQSMLEQDSATTIQSFARSASARRRVKEMREEMIEQAMKLLDETLREVQRHVAALKLQMAYRSRGARLRVADLAIAAMRERAARIIQEAYRQHQITFMITKLLAALDVSASTCASVVRAVERSVASRHLQQLFREKQLGKLVRMIVDRTEATILRAVTTVQSACRGRIARNSTKMERSLIEARRTGAIRIQKRIRIIAAQRELQLRKDARFLLIRALVARVKFTRTRNLRRRVLQRWRRKRRLTLHRPLLYWRKVAVIEAEERVERTRKLYMTSAKRFWAKKTRARLFRFWKWNVLAIIENRHKLQRALAYMRNRVRSRALRRWLIPVMATHRHKEHLTVIFLMCCARNTLNSSRQQAQLALALTNEKRLRKRHMWMIWRKSVFHTRARVERGAAFYRSHFRRKMLPHIMREWREFVRQVLALRAMISDASDFSRSQLAKRTLRTLRRNIFEVKEARRSWNCAVLHHRRALGSKVFCHLRMAWQRERLNREKIRAALHFFQHSTTSAAFRRWKVFTSEIKMEKAKLNFALQKMRRSCMSKPFRTWFLVYAEAREKREDAAACVVQRFARRRLGLIMLVKKRLQLQYEFDVAVKNETYVTRMKPSTLTRKLRKSNWRRGHDLVFVQFYAEWCKNSPSSQLIRREFAAVATLLQRNPGLRNRVAMIKAEALETDYGEQLSAVARFNLRETPTMYLFWQGTMADGYHPLWKGISRPYTGANDRNELMAFLCRQQGSVDRLQHRAAVSMQCIARVWKAVKVLEQKRVAEEERKRLAEIERKKRLKMEVTVVWIEKFDEEKGVKYWVNEKTGQKRYSMPEKGAMPTTLYTEWKAARRLQAIFRGWKGRLQAELESMTAERYPRALLCVSCGDETVEQASVS